MPFMAEHEHDEGGVLLLIEMRKDMEAHKRRRLHILVKPSKMNSCTGLQMGVGRGGRDVPKHINRELYTQRDEQSPSLFG